MTLITYTQIEIEEKRNSVRAQLLSTSKNIKSGNFTVFSNEDLWILFYLYDKLFLNDSFREILKGQLKFTFSRQLTSSAGITKCQKNLAKQNPEDYKFEIKISVIFLADYHKVERDKKVNGYTTKDPLDALMLVFEHELCHVIEYLYTFKSRCKGKAFKQMAFGIFGHTDVVHALVSKRELNSVKYGLKIGDFAQFEYKGKLLLGLIYRMNKTATVMVESKKGRFVDQKGKKYEKFQVPFDKLKTRSQINE